MTFFGVHITVALTLGLLVVLAVLIGWRMESHNRLVLTASKLGLYIVAINSPAAVKAYGIVSNNLYSEVRIVPDPAEDSRLLVINNSPSSKIAAHPEHRFAYLKFIEKEVLRRLDTDRPRRILVIGAGGFTIGLEDRFHAYTYVDIDPALQQVSEEYFLRQPLTPNKTFVPESARAFLRRNTQTYDVVVLDAFTNRISLPADLITREVFAAVRQAVAPDGQVVYEPPYPGMRVNTWLMSYGVGIRHGTPLHPCHGSLFRKAVSPRMCPPCGGEILVGVFWGRRC
jgi:hypothetical protein